MNEFDFDRDKLISIQNRIIELQNEKIVKLKSIIAEDKKQSSSNLFLLCFRKISIYFFSLLHKSKNIIKKIFNFHSNQKKKQIEYKFFLPYEKNLFFSYHKDSLEIKNNSNNLKIAVFIHICSIDYFSEIEKCLKLFPYSFDCYIFTDTSESFSFINEQLKTNPKMNRISFIEVYKETSPCYSFFKLLYQLDVRYDLICNINTYFKSLNNLIDVEQFFKYLLKHLLGSKQNIEYIINRFLTFPETGMIRPPDFPPLHKKISISSEDLTVLKDLLEHYSFPSSFTTSDSIISNYPLGTFFWIRPEVFLQSIKDNYLITKTIEKNNFSFNSDYELFLSSLLLNKKYKTENVFNNNYFKKSLKTRITFFVHFDRNNTLSETDLDYITILKHISKELIVISVSNLNESDLDKIKSPNIKIIKRANYGFDFGAWKDALMIYGFTNLEIFDEVVFANNSCFAPVFDLETVFSEMEERNKDFWGITSHAEVIDNSTLIPFHIQSYFLVFTHKVFSSKQFFDFWINLPYFETYEEAINHGELKCTEYFSQYFSFDVYCNSLIHLIDTFDGYNYSLTEPEAVLLCGSPFIKKKVFQYASEEKQKDLLCILNKITNKSYFKD